MKSTQWAVTIGLEIHAQIRCKSKLFSRACTPSSSSASSLPNGNVSLFDAAYPGTLPVLNSEAVQQAIKAALALKCKVNHQSVFERKHYFYQDLPLGYQITQQRYPIAEGGLLNYTYQNQNQGDNLSEGTEKSKKAQSTSQLIGSVRVDRIQLEQDSGKSLHDSHPSMTLVDLNRAGVGLIEIVFAPQLHSAEQAAAVLRTTQEILRHIGVCDGNMEDGSMRCDVNISVAKAGGGGTRVEIKNLNSVQRVIAAARYEANRQIQLLESEASGGASNEGKSKNEGELSSGSEISSDSPKVRRETRGFNPDTGTTYFMRTKEDATDYRYFPDPDLPFLVLTDDEIDAIRASLPDLPHETVKRIRDTYGLDEYQIGVLMSAREAKRKINNAEGEQLQSVEGSVSESSKHTPDIGESSDNALKYFENVCSKLANDTKPLSGNIKNQEYLKPTSVFHWVMSELQGHLNAENRGFSDSPVSPAQLAEILALLAQDTISTPQAKSLLAVMFVEADLKASALTVANRLGLKNVGDESVVQKLCTEAVNDPANADQLRRYRGEQKHIQLLLWRCDEAQSGSI